MKTTRKLIAGILVFALVLGGAVAGYSVLSQTVRPTQPAAQDQTKTPPRTAPDFAVEDGKGNALRLADMRGKPVVLNFWASWCSPCKNEMPGFEAAFQALGDEVQFMMVNLTDGSRETKALGAAFVAEQGYTFPVFFDTEMQGADAYGITSIPATYFISREGEIVHNVMGELTEESLREGIARIQ